MLEASKPSEATVPEPWKLWKLLVLPIVSMIFAAKFMETISKTNNFHYFWWLEASKPSEAIVPEIMEIIEAVGFTNNFQGFCYQNHGNYWFQGRKHSQNLGQWGGVPYIYIYIYIYTYIYIHIYTYIYIWSPPLRLAHPLKTV